MSPRSSLSGWRRDQPRGEQNAAAKLTETQVIEIRAAVGTHKQIARQYGVAASTVGEIRLGLKWKHVPGPLPAPVFNRGQRHPASKLTEADIVAIRAAVGSQREIAKRYGVHQGTISEILLGRIWKHVL
jgi:DNA invertase Pin-like site-specific DNA recombinase